MMDLRSSDNCRIQDPREPERGKKRMHIASYYLVGMCALHAQPSRILHDNVEEHACSGRTIMRVTGSCADSYIL